uniref:RanBD1 domain-containing protein n=2 Tax=Phaeomonas parva TaxID=124430 RepID=A0A6U4KVX5_9STRA|mmetsp:Transcript_760/g.1919  ORF Transcript_760/g.1919 Transcript_760/m.1919 type:complete len:151 (+) Transcript_760:435-887(+)
MLDKDTGNFTWLNRGIGEIKILKHRENGMIRLLMRQEKTMKVIVNHIADPRIVMSANNGSDRSWVWSAFDYADGELKETVFAIKFSDRDVAAGFKTKFTEAQETMSAHLAGADAPPSAEADEAAAAIAGLSTDDAAAAAPAADEEKKEET